MSLNENITLKELQIILNNIVQHDIDSLDFNFGMNYINVQIKGDEIILDIEKVYTNENFSKFDERDVLIKSGILKLSFIEEFKKEFITGGLASGGILKALALDTNIFYMRIITQQILMHPEFKRKMQSIPPMFYASYVEDELNIKWDNATKIMKKNKEKGFKERQRVAIAKIEIKELKKRNYLQKYSYHVSDKAYETIKNRRGPSKQDVMDNKIIESYHALQDEKGYDLFFLTADQGNYSSACSTNLKSIFIVQTIQDYPRKFLIDYAQMAQFIYVLTYTVNTVSSSIFLNEPLRIEFKPPSNLLAIDEPKINIIMRGDSSILKEIRRDINLYRTIKGVSY